MNEKSTLPAATGNYKMTNIISFNSDAFRGLGLHYTAQSWTLADVLTLAETYQSDDLTELASIADTFNAEVTDTVLTSYTGKDKKIYFSTPRVQLNKEGELAVFIGDASYPLTFKNGAWVVGESDIAYKLKVNRNKETKEITSIVFTQSFTRGVDGFDEDFELQLRLITTKDADRKVIAQSLQKGEIPDGILKVGAGGNFKFALKPYMLPAGYYRIAEVFAPKFLESGGKIWEGLVVSVDENGNDLPLEEYRVKMNAKPFVSNKKETLLHAAMGGAKVYLRIDGAVETGVGIGAIAHAMPLQTSDNGAVKAAFWEMFKKEASIMIASEKQRNASKLLSTDRITELRNEAEAADLAKLEAWKAKQNNKVADESVGEVDTDVIGATREPELVGASASNGKAAKATNYDDIPF